MSRWNVGPSLEPPCACCRLGCRGECELDDCERCDGAGYVTEAADEHSAPARHQCPDCSEERDAVDETAERAATDADEWIDRQADEAREHAA